MKERKSKVVEERTKEKKRERKTTERRSAKSNAANRSTKLAFIRFSFLLFINQPTNQLNSINQPNSILFKQCKQSNVS